MRGFRDARVYLEDEGIQTCDLAFDTHILSVDGDAEIDEVLAIPEGCIVLPGFIDTHIHGAGGADTMDGTTAALAIMADTLVREGTTSFLATTMTQAEEGTLRALSAVADYCRTSHPAGARLLGAHLEGPFINNTYAGAQPRAYITEPSVAYFDRMYEASEGNVRRVTIAPELPHAVELIAHMTARGVRSSVGHSDATDADISRAIEAGLTGVTHTFNAQRPLHHREIGVVGAALLHDELTCELIADTIHVSPAAMRLLVQSRGAEHVTLITDAMREKGMPDGISELGGQTVYVKDGEARLADGTLAGSVAKMNDQVRHMVEQVGLHLTTAVDCASLYPARALGIDEEFGGIRVGKRADFTVLSPDFRVMMTIRDGKVVYIAIE